MELQKAIISEVTSKGEADSFPVQFNPTTLRLTLNNQVEGGQSQGRQVRQFVGPSSTTLAVDLVFDTADEGTTSEPVSVREKTRKVERFLLTKPGGRENKPPRIKFAWGDLAIEGVVDSLSIDFDHFAANGAALRAKVSLSIKGQDREQELKPLSDDRGGATAPTVGGSGGAPGLGVSAGAGLSAGLSAGFSAGIGASASIGFALEGESAAEFAVRMGVDPGAWRGLDFGGESSLSLSAGATIGFSAGLTASAGLSASVGVEAGVSASLDGAFGLSAGAEATFRAGTGVAGRLSTGFALSGVGGLSAAIETVQHAKNSVTAQQTREAFQAPAPPAPAVRPGASIAASRSPGPVLQAAAAPAQDRTPWRATDSTLPGAGSPSSPAPPRPRADKRASSFGSGVPLRPVLGEASLERADSIQGSVALRPKATGGAPPVSDNPGTPPWKALPRRDPGRTAAEKNQNKRAPRCGCEGGGTAD